MPSLTLSLFAPYLGHSLARPRIDQVPGKSTTGYTEACPQLMPNSRHTPLTCGLTRSLTLGVLSSNLGLPHSTAEAWNPPRPSEIDNWLQREM
jgi:hypothetical protein